MVIVISLLCTAFVVVSYFRFRLQNFQFPTFNRFDNPASRASFSVRTLTFAWLALYHFWLLLNPQTLSCDWTHSSIELIDFSPSHFWFDIYRTSLIAAFFAGLTLIACRMLSRAYSYHKSAHHHRAPQKIHKFLTPEQESRIKDEENNRRFFHAFALLVIPFIPVSNLFFSTGFVIAERVLYLPSIGFTLLVGLGLQRLYQRLNSGVPTLGTSHSMGPAIFGIQDIKSPRNGERKESAPQDARVRFQTALYSLFLMVLLCGLSFKTHTRSLEWRNEMTLYSSGLRVNPRNTKLLNNLGRVYEREHHFHRATKLYQQAIRISPDDIRGYLNLGNILVRQNALTEAEKTYRAALATVERNIVSTTNKRTESTAQKQTSPASIAASFSDAQTQANMQTTAAGVDRTHAPVTVSQHTQHQNWQLTATGSTFGQKSWPNSQPELSAIGRDMSEKNDEHDESEESLVENLAQSGGQLSDGNGDIGISALYLTAMLRLAELIDRNASRRNELEGIKAKMSALQARLRSNSQPDASGYQNGNNNSKHHLNHLYNLAIINHRQGHTDRALELFSKILAQDPDHIESLLASARIIQDKDLDNLNNVAWSRLERLLKLGHKDATVYFNMAMLSTKFGNDDRAIGFFEEAIHRQGSFIEAHYNLALLLIKKLEFLRQQAELGLSTEYSASSPWQNRQKVFSRAESHLLKALEINSHHGKSMLVLGDLYAEEMLIDKSRFYYESVINFIDSQHFRARHNLCVLLHKEEKTEESIRCFQALRNQFSSSTSSSSFTSTHDSKDIKQTLANIDLQIEFLKSECLMKNMKNRENSSPSTKVDGSRQEKSEQNLNSEQKPYKNGHRNKSDSYSSSHAKMDAEQPQNQEKNIDILSTLCSDVTANHHNLGTFEFAQMCHI